MKSIKQKVSFYLFFTIIFLSLTTQANSSLPKIDDFSIVSELSKRSNAVIVVLVEQTGCHYCEIVSEEFLYPMHKFGKYKDKAIFRRISLDRGETITNIEKKKLTTDAFCEDYDANFTPTVLFLDGDGNSLTEKILGMSSQDFYGYKLEKSINKAYQAMRNGNE